MRLVPLILTSSVIRQTTVLTITAITSRVHAFTTLVALTTTTTTSAANYSLRPVLARPRISSRMHSDPNNIEHDTDTDTDTDSLPLDKLSDYANSYAAANGLQVETKRTNDNDNDNGNNDEDNVASYQCAPISLLPNVFPSESFLTAKNLAPNFNLLVDRIARNGDFLQETLGGEGGVTGKDEFTRILLEMHRDIYMDADATEGSFARTADRLGILRSDYMLNRNDDDKHGEGKYDLKQVELNTIASSFAGLAVNVAGLHSLLTQRFPKDVQPWIDANRERVMGKHYTNPNTNPDELGVPTNPALTCLPQAIHAAHERYAQRFPPTPTTPQRVVLFVVQDGETNTVDQRMLEFHLWQNHRVPVVRLSLTRSETDLHLDESTGALTVRDGGVWCEVSVVYFRAGYAPTDYPGGEGGVEWMARRTMERSRAAKCPNLGYHLAGTKKVQQALARPGVLERFFGGDEGVEIVNGLKGAFAGLYSLGEDAVEEDIDAVSKAISGAEGDYVLKPQREGGGYNYYGDRLAAKLKENTKCTTEGELELGEDLAEFILMQRLFPPWQRAVLLRAGKVEGMGESISELGVFGTIVATHEGQALHNQYSGFLLRTKFSDVDEGGVASGFATLSSPYLC